MARSGHRRLWIRIVQLILRMSQQMEVLEVQFAFLKLQNTPRSFLLIKCCSVEYMVDGIHMISTFDGKEKEMEEWMKAKGGLQWRF